MIVSIFCASFAFADTLKPQYNNDYANYKNSDESKLVTLEQTKYNNDYANHKNTEGCKTLTLDEPKYNNDYANGSAPVKTHHEEKHTAATSKDSDHDGVADADDKCANTPAGTKVNSLGCALTEKVEMVLNIQFDNGKSVVKSEYHNELKKMADLLNAHPDMGAEIQGHTDNVGKEKANVALSDARAKAVKQYLSDKLGVKWDHLTGKGYGSSKPIADNNSAEGREKNRRVVAVLQSLNTVKSLKAKKQAEEAKASQKH